MNSVTTEWETSTIGVPQGAILATILTNTYSSDSESSSPDQHGEYSDDNLKLVANEDENIAAAEMQALLDQFANWGRINNIEISNPKTKFMVFRPKSSPRPYNKIKLWLEGKLVEEVDSHRILGTLFDNELTFEPHFQQVIAKGYGVLQE